MGKLVMGYWDCPVCGTQGIRGDTVNCPSCGRARGDVQFYMKDHAESQTREQGDTADIEYVDEEKAKTASRNPDWYCSFCNSLNSDNAQFCANCGASRESSEANYFDRLKKKQEQEAAMAPPQPTAQELAQTRTAPKSKRGLIFLLVAIVAIVGLFMYMNGDKTAGDLTVSALSWERNIQIEENVQYSESGWDLPDGAELTSQRQEIHHYDSVLDHYENVEVQRSRRVIDHYETYYTYNDLGNGNFEQVENQRPVYETEYYTETIQQPVYRQVPRYATKYYYDIWRWTPTRVATASGTDHEAAWPEPELGENERTGDRAEEYRFTVTDKDGRETAYSLAEADWRNLSVGQSLSITSKRSGANPYIVDSEGNKIADVVRVR